MGRKCNIDSVLEKEVKSEHVNVREDIKSSFI